MELTPVELSSEFPLDAVTTAGAIELAEAAPFGLLFEADGPGTVDESTN